MANAHSAKQAPTKQTTLDGDWLAAVREAVTFNSGHVLDVDSPAQLERDGVAWCGPTHWFRYCMKWHRALMLRDADDAFETLTPYVERIALDETGEAHAGTDAWRAVLPDCDNRGNKMDPVADFLHGWEQTVGKAPYRLALERSRQTPYTDEGRYGERFERAHRLRQRELIALCEALADLMKMKERDFYLSARKAAALLGRDKDTTAKWLREGEGVYFRITRRGTRTKAPRRRWIWGREPEADEDDGPSF